MKSLCRVDKVRIEPSATDLAKCFCSMDDHEMAVFFNTIAQVTKHWDNPIEFQLDALAKNKDLLSSGRLIMAKIGEYSK